MDRQTAEDIAQRARIRHQHVSAKRDRLKELRREVAASRQLLRGLIKQAAEALAGLESRLDAYAQELDREETAIGNPVVKDPSQETTRVLRARRDRILD